MSEPIISHPYPDITLEFYEEKHYAKANGVFIPFSASKVANCRWSDALAYWQRKCMAQKLDELLEAGKTITSEDIWDAIKESDRRKGAEATRGTAAHAYAERYIQHHYFKIGEEPQLPEDEKARNATLAWLRWLNSEHKIEPIETEKILFSKKHFVWGITDFVACVDGLLAIVDYKASGPKSASSLCCNAKAKKNKKDTAYLCEKCGEVCEDIQTDGVYPNHRWQTALYQMMYEEMTGEKVETRWIIRFDKITAHFESHKIGEYEKDKRAALHALELLKREAELETKL